MLRLHRSHPLSYRAALKALREGNAQLKHEVMLQNRFSVAPSTQSASAYIANLQDQSEVLAKKVGANLMSLGVSAPLL